MATAKTKKTKQAGHPMGVKDGELATVRLKSGRVLQGSVVIFGHGTVDLVWNEGPVTLQASVPNEEVSSVRKS